MRIALHSARRRRGTNLVECALVMSLCLLFIFGILEYARYVMVRQVLDNAAREGARFAVVNTYNATTAQVQNAADAALGGQGPQLQGYNKTSSIQVFLADPATGNNIGLWTDAKFGDAIAVTISGTYNPILPSFLYMSSTMQVKGECVMRSEAN